jgi:glucosyl-3-phosphoglycerate synthase
MADFYQSGLVTTLHRFAADSAHRAELELARHAASRPVALALPALYSEFEHPAMRGIANELRGQSFLSRIVVALGRANEAQYHHARSFFEGFDTPVTFLQVDHPKIAALLRNLAKQGLRIGAAGKGRACWLAAGYLLAQGGFHAIAFHDCDIRNYRRSLVARLCSPLAHPGLEFEYAKGYYARVSNQLYGRVTRLFFTPLVRALRGLEPGCGFFEYLDSFRYALAGEFAMTANLARSSSFGAGWALEVGLLAEAWRNCGARRVCQIDISDNYEHKHQELSAADAGKGLRRMSVEIARALLDSAAAEGIALTPAVQKMLEERYLFLAREAVRRFEADALCNGLGFDRHAEESAVEAFRLSLREACAAENRSCEDLPPWSRVLSAAPHFFDQLLDAVAATDPNRTVSAPGWCIEEAAAAAAVQ